MHWVLWAILACLVFLATYKPNTGNLQNFFKDTLLVETNVSSTTQSNRDTDESD